MPGSIFGSAFSVVKFWCLGAWLARLCVLCVLVPGSCVARPHFAPVERRFAYIFVGVCAPCVTYVFYLE